MKSNIKTVFLLVLTLLLGCQKFVEIDPPKDQLISKSVFTSNETATSAITGLYTSIMQNNAFEGSYRITLNAGLYSDELEYKATIISSISVYKNSLNANDSPTNLIWARGYFHIYQANSIIEGLEKSTGVTEQVKQQLTGEALFVRAFMHFYLLNLYGDVPLVTTTDYTVNSKLPKTASQQVYEQIMADLIKAKTLLSDKYVDATSVVETTSRIRPNKLTASALLARVYLYTQKWDLAEQEASSLIGSPKYQLENIATVFKDISKEAIWQLQMPTPATRNTFEAQGFILTSPTSGSACVIYPTLLSKFSADDLRKSNWIGLLKSGTTEYFFPYKYKTRGTVAMDEHVVCFRLAEQYLIRAEARAQQSKLSTAIDDLDAIRARAGLSLIKNTNAGIGKEALLDAIMDERQKELFCEWGHRWLDLKRTGKVNGAMSVVMPQKGGVWNASKALWPIPFNDINNNRNLTQNEGYE